MLLWVCLTLTSWEETSRLMSPEPRLTEMTEMIEEEEAEIDLKRDMETTAEMTDMPTSLEEDMRSQEDMREETDLLHQDNLLNLRIPSSLETFPGALMRLIFKMLSEDVDTSSQSEFQLIETLEDRRDSDTLPLNLRMLQTRQFHCLELILQEDPSESTMLLPRETKMHNTNALLLSSLHCHANSQWLSVDQSRTWDIFFKDRIHMDFGHNFSTQVE